VIDEKVFEEEVVIKFDQERRESMQQFVDELVR
jgi:hypothetical protein